MFRQGSNISKIVAWIASRPNASHSSLECPCQILTTQIPVQQLANMQSPSCYFIHVACFLFTKRMLFGVCHWFLSLFWQMSLHAYKNTYINMIKHVCMYIYIYYIERERYCTCCVQRLASSKCRSLRSEDCACNPLGMVGFLHDLLDEKLPSSGT